MLSKDQPCMVSGKLTKHDNITRPLLEKKTTNQNCSIEIEIKKMFNYSNKHSIHES